MRRALFFLLCLPGVNGLVRALLRPFRRHIPKLWRDRVPFVGTLALPLENGSIVRFTSDGAENMSSVLDWEGWEGFEPETRRVFLALLDGCRVFFDVGAYMGFYSVLAAIASPARRVYAFEPVPRSYQRLLANLRANALGNVRAVRAAAGDRDGETTLYVPGGVWLPSHSSTRSDFRAGSAALTVPAITLDCFAREEGVDAVDLMKIDTEGNEDAVLDGARELVSRHRPVVLCEVLRGLTETRLNEYFRPLEYGFFRIAPGGLEPLATIEGDASYRDRNFLFVPRERIAVVQTAAEKSASR